MKVDVEKIGVIASYLAENVDNLYVTKLLKLFYYIDFISHKERGASITNDVYFKLPYGPVPSLIKNEIDNLSGKTVMEKSMKSQLASYIILEEDDDKFGRKIINKKNKYNIDKLSENEKDIIDRVLRAFKEKTATQLSNQTHKEKPWLLTSANSIIQYELADTLDVKKILAL